MGHYCGWQLTPPMAAPDIRITGPRRTECSWHQLGLGTECPCPRLWRCQVRCQVSLSMSGITSHHRLRWETNLPWHNHLSIHTQWRLCLPLETWSWVGTLRSGHSRHSVENGWRPHISQYESAWQYNSPHGFDNVLKHACTKSSKSLNYSVWNVYWL